VMSTFLAKWEPVDLIILVSVLAGTAVLIVGIVAWRRIWLTQADAELKEALLNRGLSVEDVMRLSPPAPPEESEAEPTADETLGEIAGYLTTAEMPAPDVEEVMALVAAATPPARRTLAGVLAGMAESGAEPEQMLGAVRGLCRSATFADAPRA